MDTSSAPKSTGPRLKPEEPEIHVLSPGATQVREAESFRGIREGFVLAEASRASINWRGIFAGAFLSLLCFMLLTALGLGIGGATLASIIQGTTEGGGFGLGTGLYIVVSALISLFFGSYYSARVSGLIPSRVGMVQGLVIASLFFAFAFFQVGAAVGMIGQGIGAGVGAAGTAIGSAAQNPQVQSIVQSSLGDLNLKSPPNEVIQRLATRIVQGDTVGARNYLAQQADISPAEAQRRIDSVQTDVTNAARSVGMTAARVISATGWTVFFSVLLGSICAALGGMYGSRKNLEEPTSEADVRRARAA